MKVILSPHRTPYFGQDFTIDFLIKHAGLVPVYLKDGEYDISAYRVSEITLIISRYPDLAADARFINRYGDQIPVAIHLHLKFNFLQPDQRAFLRSAISRASSLICNCEMLSHEYQKLFPAYRWDFINNGIESAIFYPAKPEERLQFKKQHDIPEDKILLCYTGRLNNSKGLQLLERVLAYVSESARYFMVIQCIYLPKYKTVIERIGNQYKNLKIMLDQSSKVVRYTDIHISPSLCETTSLVTLEALFSGVPVVCTDVTTFYQEIENGYASFPYFRKVKIEHSAIMENNGKNELKIKVNFISEIASRFVQEIEKTSPFTQEQREVLGANFSVSEYNSAKMLYALTRHYDLLVRH